MARRERIDLEITLESLRLLPHEDRSESRHLLTVDLIWPRVLIPQRTSVRPLTLRRGLWGGDPPPGWCRRILFKETLEGVFGIRCGITSSIQGTAWRKAVRAIASGAIHLGADMVEDALPAGGRFAALPVDHLAGEIRNLPPPPVLARAETDLDAADLSGQDVHTLKLTLLAEHAITRMVPKGPPRARRQTRETLFPQDSPAGEITLRLKPI